MLGMLTRMTHRTYYLVADHQIRTQRGQVLRGQDGKLRLTGSTMTERCFLDRDKAIRYAAENYAEQLKRQLGQTTED